jgi:hypothetical protein
VKLRDQTEMERYKAVVERPMDLGTIKARAWIARLTSARGTRARLTRGHGAQKSVLEGQYKDPAKFAEDVRLIWSNCRKFNKPGATSSRVRTVRPR